MVEIPGSSPHTIFRFRRPGATAVCLVGSFNDWRVGDLPLLPEGDGWWRAQVLLPPGTYRFRYWADGQWYSDYAAFGVRLGPFGFESVLDIPRSPVRKPRGLVTAALGAG